MEAQKVFIIPKDMDLDDVELFEDESIYSVKNDVTREYIHIHAASREQAISRAGWLSIDVKWCYAVKMHPKKKMPDAVKENLKALQQERRALRNAGRKTDEVLVADLQAPAEVTNFVIQAQAKTRVREQLVALWGTLKGFTQDQKVDAIAQLLKARNPLTDVVKQSKWYYYKLKRELGE